MRAYSGTCARSPRRCPTAFGWRDRRPRWYAFLSRRRALTSPSWTCWWSGDRRTSSVRRRSAPERMQVRHARSAAQQGHAAPAQEPADGGDGVRGWLSGLPGAARGTTAAAVDTRLDKPFAGGAAPRIARRLRRRGYALAADPD